MRYLALMGKIFFSFQHHDASSEGHWKEKNIFLVWKTSRWRAQTLAQFILASVAQFWLAFKTNRCRIMGALFRDSINSCAMHYNTEFAREEVSGWHDNQGRWDTSAAAKSAYGLAGSPAPNKDGKIKKRKNRFSGEKTGNRWLRLD